MTLNETIRHLEDRGVAPGWDCLEVGGGSHIDPRFPFIRDPIQQQSQELFLKRAES